MHDFGTVEKIVEYVKPLIDEYIKFPKKKDEIRTSLRLVFFTDLNVWPTIIKENKFVEAFKKPMGKNRRKTLKKFLCGFNGIDSDSSDGIDSDFYKKVDFDID